MARVLAVKTNLFAERGAPVRLVADVVVVGDVGDDRAAEFDGVDGALSLIDDFAVGLDQDGVGNGSVPLRVEGGNQRIDVGRSENQIAAGGVLFLQGGRGRLLFRRDS